MSQPMTPAERVVFTHEALFQKTTGYVIHEPVANSLMWVALALSSIAVAVVAREVKPEPAVDEEEA